MVRKMVGGLFALAIFALGGFADEYKGKIKSVDAEKGTLTVTVGDKDREFKVPATAKFTAGKKDLAEGLKSKQFAKANKVIGLEVTIVTEKKEGTETVSEVKIQKKAK